MYNRKFNDFVTFTQEDKNKLQENLDKLQKTGYYNNKKLPRRTIEVRAIYLNQRLPVRAYQIINGKVCTSGR